MSQIISSLATIAQHYDALFVDLWGCVHDGVRPFPDAVAALQTYRQNGGIVVFITNAPRPRRDVERQLAAIGVPQMCWDDIASSGDTARTALYLGVVGKRIYHIGAPTDTGFFTPPSTIEAPWLITRVPLEQADGIVCTGPFDPSASPETLRPQLAAAKARGLKLLCANSDIVVDRGERREYCAGAVARLYAHMGGESLYFGKPHALIYDLARRRLARIAAVPDARILAIGDGPGTDVAGALNEGLDILFIAGGLSARDTGTAPGGQPDRGRLDAFLAGAGLAPTYVIGALR